MSAHGAIGGYFEQARERGAPLPWKASAQGFVSARAAIEAVLRATRAERVWAPRYACSALFDAIAASGARWLPYDLGETLAPVSLHAAPGDWVVCVDYFGLCGDAIERMLRSHPAERLLVDASQSLYRAPDSAATWVYSPRKFAGLPDGGWLVTPHAVPAPAVVDEVGSRQRARAGLARAQGDVAGGFELYREAERSLDGLAPQGMSACTRELLDRIDFPAAAERRRANYAWLAAAAARLGLAARFELGAQVPLCLPVRSERAAALRAHLARHRIYTPHYWPGLQAADATAQALLHQTLFLPIDQRYGKAEMRRIADCLGDAAAA